TDDVKDGKNYTYLLNQLDNEKCNLDPLNEADDNARNQKVIDNAKTLGAKTYAKPEELSSGNETANLLHTAAIYNAIHGLEDKEEPDTPEEASQRKAYAKFINKKLGDVENIQKNLPINPDNGDLYDKVKNGLIVCDLVNKVAPGTIDERCIEVGDDLDDLQKEENVKLGIASAKGVGVKNDEIKPESYLDSKMHKGELLNHLGQLAREIEYVPITLKDHPELIRLLNQDEQISELLKMKPEDILLRWMNHHLKKAGQPEVA
ncbi:MAG: hypothetical protein MJ252_27420, partial [archaeon]|nr:hypothetical protein [archaeon]